MMKLIKHSYAKSPEGWLYFYKEGTQEFNVIYGHTHGQDGTICGTVKTVKNESWESFIDTEFDKKVL